LPSRRNASSPALAARSIRIKLPRVEHSISTRPCLKVVGLHIEGLRALRRVDWPADGMGWQGQVPDMVMVGGVNGSGKTTLLEVIGAAVRVLHGWSHLPESLNDACVWIDFYVSSSVTGQATIRVLCGDEEFVAANKTDDCIALTRQMGAYSPMVFGATWNKTHQLLSGQLPFSVPDFPVVLYLPTERRLEIPAETFKSLGKLAVPSGFFFRFQGAQRWKESIEAMLYAARWEDLNAKEEGRPQDAYHFESYAKAFQAFFGGTKSLVWEGGELFVKMSDTGERHPLTELSSGEKQAVLLTAELLRRWRPGSLILIDEPELHFHPSWQTTLWSMLTEWQKERGGQVIVATQSNHLFRIGDPGSKVLLGIERLG
jgi:predicted ATPase